jgi:1-deoxy-D-xylulose-5-phosphate reductoisomerase
MKLPIQYALSYPERWENQFVNTDFPVVKDLSFFEPDFSKFRCLKLAYDVLEQGGTYPCILNAANEIAVEKFLKEEISFLQIPDLIEFALNGIEKSDSISYETIIECDRQTREYSLKFN